MVIPLTECKNGYLYQIDSRNLSYGVFREGVNGFVGIREKMGHIYLFTEYHEDTGPPYGTVRPRCEIELCPIADLTEGYFSPDKSDPNKAHYVSNKELFDWLDEKGQYYEKYFMCICGHGTGNHIKEKCWYYDRTGADTHICDCAQYTKCNEISI